MFDIYRNRGTFKLLILIMALIIGSLSIYYTDKLVDKLAEGEQKQIDLYAKGLKALVDPDNDGSVSLIFEEIINANHSIPVILTDENQEPISDKNVELPPNLSALQKKDFYKREIAEMKDQHEPILVEYAGIKNFIFYKNSYILTQLRYYPYVQLTIIAIFAILAYLAFSYSRNSEQNRVWVGMAKETAHQLGTPLSSLMAWVEIFKTDPAFNKEMVTELQKDVDRLEMITARFSSIGSAAMLKEENILEAIKSNINYLQKRVSSKIIFEVHSELPEDTQIRINRALFDWVIENICKNAVDAIGSQGNISVTISPLSGQKIAIDIKDNGKGISRGKIKEVFRPGFTTKSRGWGLGLTLVKRIVENYHKGKIFVLSSEPGVGTTFRIVLKA